MGLFIIGILLGTLIGVFIMALMVTASNSEKIDRILEKEKNRNNYL